MNVSRDMSLRLKRHESKEHLPEIPILKSFMNFQVTELGMASQLQDGGRYRLSLPVVSADVGERPGNLSFRAGLFSSYQFPDPGIHRLVLEEQISEVYLTLVVAVTACIIPSKDG